MSGIVSPPATTDVVPLGTLHGLALGASAVRAYGRYSDLMCAMPASINDDIAHQIDLCDHLLDLVCIDPAAPAGFRFTGLSIMEFWRALRRSRQAPGLVTAWHEALRSPAMSALRQAAQPRYPEPFYQYMHELRLPPGYGSAPLLCMPDALAAQKFFNTRDGGGAGRDAAGMTSGTWMLAQERTASACSLRPGSRRPRQKPRQQDCPEG